MRPYFLLTRSHRDERDRERVSFLPRNKDGIEGFVVSFLSRRPPCGKIPRGYSHEDAGVKNPALSCKLSIGISGPFAPGEVRRLASRLSACDDRETSVGWEGLDYAAPLPGDFNGLFTGLGARLR